MGHTLVLEVPEEVYEPLTKAAEKTGRSLEQVVQEWLVTAVQYSQLELPHRTDAPLSPLSADQVDETAQDDPVEKWMGAFRSNVPDWGINHDKYLGEALYAEMRGDVDEND